jgi:hypothetical protein
MMRKPHQERPSIAEPTLIQHRHSFKLRITDQAVVELEACARCGGTLTIIASIEEPQVIAKILAHLERTGPYQCQSELPLGARAPPAQSQSALKLERWGSFPLSAKAAGWVGVCLAYPGRRGAGRIQSGRGSAAPKGLLVAGVAGQGLMMADLGLRRCPHKAGYTNGLGRGGGLNFLSACEIQLNVEPSRRPTFPVNVYRGELRQ